jgi:hypothetical protein
MPFPTRLPTLGLFLAASGLALLGGCSSEPKPGPASRPHDGRTAPRNPRNAMAGQEYYFTGQILAEIAVNSEGLPEVSPGPAGGGGKSDSGRDPSGGSNSMHMHGGSSGTSGSVSRSVPFGGHNHPAPEHGTGEAAGPRPILGGDAPVMIHLRLTNQGPTRVVVGIADFVSPLGDFAVRPETLTLEPGTTLETEPMTSQLAGELTEADVTLVLQMGGRAEKKVFRLHPVSPPAKAPGGEAQPVQGPNPPKS